MQYKKESWDLDDIAPNPDLDSALKKISLYVSSFEGLKAKLKNASKSDILNAISLKEKIYENLGRLESYSMLRASENTQDNEIKAFNDRIEQFATDIANRMLFFDIWWIFLDDKTTDALLPNNSDYAYYLGKLRKGRAHTLNEEAEKAINLKSITSFSAWVNLYEKRVGAFTFNFKPAGKLVKTEDGSAKLFVREELMRFAQSDKATEREAAYKSILDKFASEGSLLADIYSNVIRDWNNENVKLRRFESPISARNFTNDVTDSAVNALIETCRKNAGVFQRFFRLKADYLGFKTLSRYDLYAPISKYYKRFDYNESVNLVLRAFKSFDKTFAEYAKNIFDKKHVDSKIKFGKAAGAFCANSSPKDTPYLFLNYDGRLRDVYTMAHESGHGVHSQLSSKHSILTHEPSLPMAETASVFGEMVFFDYINNNNKDIKLKRGLLGMMLDNMYATIQRQAYFVLFEKRAHDAINSGGTTDETSRIYLETLKEQFGDSVTIPEEFRWEWSYVPHFFRSPFYVYAYSFGELLTLSLYDIYKKEGDSFKRNVLHIFESGGSKSPDKILEKYAGIDINSTAFWQHGFGLVNRLIDEFKDMRA